MPLFCQIWHFHVVVNDGGVEDFDPFRDRTSQSKTRHAWAHRESAAICLLVDGVFVLLTISRELFRAYKGDLFALWLLESVPQIHHVFNLALESVELLIIIVRRLHLSVFLRYEALNTLPLLCGCR